MWCRALLTLIAISYLICVLLLSGLQKEDLDVNMLRKLQRHNVNIDDVNYEDLRQECLLTSTPNIVSIAKENYVSQKEQPKESTMQINNNITEETDLNAVIKYFIQIRKPKEEIGKYKNNTTPQVPATNIAETNLATEINDEIVQRGGNQIKISENTKRYTLDNILSVLNMFHTVNTNNGITQTQHRNAGVTPSLEIEKSTAIKNSFKNDDDMRRIEMEYINKFITDKLANSRTTVSSTTTKTELRIESVPQHIERFLRNYPISQNKYPYNINVSNNNGYDNIGNLENVKNINSLSSEKADVYRKLILERKAMANHMNDEIEKSRLKDEAIEYLTNILGANGQLRIDGPFFNYSQNITRGPYINTHNSAQRYSDIKIKEHAENIPDIKASNDFYTNLEHDNKIKKTKELKSLPADTIKEIADNVKAMILKDLKRELYSTTFSAATSTTTEAAITEAQKHDQPKFREANIVMEKFMELFQQFKTIKESTLISGDAKYKVTEQKHVNQGYNGLVKIMYSPPMSLVNPYEIRSNTEQILPILIDQHKPNFKTNLPTEDNYRSQKQIPVNKLTTFNMLHPQEQSRVTPITIQTNLDEIPPLGIPISVNFNSAKMINQNIVVTTKHPFMKPVNVGQYRDYVHHAPDNYNINNEDVRNKYKKPYAKSTYLKREPNDFTRQNYRDTPIDNMRFTNRDGSKYNNDYRDKSRYASHDYRPHYVGSDKERIRHRNQEVKRFHEKLEKIGGDWNRQSREGKHSGDMNDDYKLRVASRQQQSMNMKTRSRYDDTHFRNFLKTQQKVNDMLERILATKTRADGPRSVEYL